MVLAHEPTSFELLHEEGLRRGSDGALDGAVAADFEQHARTYRTFLRGVGIFVAHIAVILVLMYLLFVR